MSEMSAQNSPSARDEPLNALGQIFVEHHKNNGAFYAANDSLLHFLNTLAEGSVDIGGNCIC